ncbi:MAG: class I SAM-dependent methyltransferase [Armatimonadetes bacterium]|nr:class I SAM-dependent methyltransferase [Armatimonadota bacterium]
MTPKRERVREMFGRVAARYDRLNSLLSLGLHHRWRRVAVRHCRFPPGGLALDVAAGTGDFAIETIGADGRAVGVDPCAPMLAAGLPKLRERGLDHRVQMVVGEAEHLPVASNRFDCATIGFGLRNVTDVEATFREMTRAVRPEGRVVALEISRPRNPLFRPLFLFYFYRLSPWLARLFGGDPDAYTYLPNSVKTFYSREELAEMMRRAGLVDVYWRDLSGGAVCLHVGTKPAETAGHTRSQGESLAIIR